MAKVVDITEKLSFDTNPVIRVRNTEIEVNTDAETILRILGIMDGAEKELDAVLEAADLLLGEEGMEKLKKMRLSFKDFMTAVHEAINVAIGEEDEESEGEGETHTTT